MINIYFDDTNEYALSRHKNGRYYYGIRNIKTNETNVKEVSKEEFYNLVRTLDVSMNKIVNEGEDEE